MPQVIKPKPASASKGGNGLTIAGIVIFLLAIAAVAVYFLVYEPFQQKKQAAIPPPVAVVDSVAVDTVAMSEPVDLLESEPVEQFVEAPVEPIVVRYDSDPNVERGFYIIAGSYRSRRNAEKFAEQLSKDIDCKVLFFESSGLYRVSCGKYGNIHTAYNDRISIRDLEGCAEAWILENR